MTLLLIAHAVLLVGLVTVVAGHVWLAVTGEAR
jgi:hypothetical protein